MFGNRSASDSSPAYAAGDWTALLRAFPAAPAELAGQRELQRRTDSKFVIPAKAAAELLPALTRDYALLRAGESLVAAYRTLYFDTSELDLFHAHRRGRRLRHKVRIRHYPDRRVSVLEVKTRLNDTRTSKARRPRDFGDNLLTAPDHSFIGERLGSCLRLVPQVWTEFQRITLLSLHTQERVTIDLGLRVGGAPWVDSLRPIAIIEVKQDHFERRTSIMQALHAAGWSSTWVSKFCAAIVFQHPTVRCTRLLPKLRTLRRVAA